VIPSNRRETERPSHQELRKKLRDALECVRAKRWLPANVKKLKANWDQLEAEGCVESAVFPEEQTEILVTALTEAKPEHYEGERPPGISYEQQTKGLEWFAFCWNSPTLGNRDIFFRFSVVMTGGTQRAWIYSLHPSQRLSQEQTLT
jgi:hypothetical protein